MEFFPRLLTRRQSDDLVDQIEAHFETHGYSLWATEERDSSTFIGFVGLLVPRFEAHFTPCVEIGWRLARASWGRGYATEAAQAAMRHAFEQAELEQIVSMTTPINQRSRRVMEKLAMTHDAADDFDHPHLPEGHPLRRHVLYRRSRAHWAAANG